MIDHAAGHHPAVPRPQAPEATGIPAAEEGILRHRLLSRRDLEESLDHRLITIEHEIQQINEQLHGHGHDEFSYPQDCGSSTRVNHDEFHHPRCEHCGMSMVPDGL